MHGARESIWRQPLGHRVWLYERAIDLVGFRAQDSMESNGVGHDQASYALLLRSKRQRTSMTASSKLRVRCVH
jgi:hypothetical protein